MKKRVEIIEHKGKKIVYADYSGVRGAEFVRTIEQQELESFALTDETILHLLNFTDCRMDDAARKRADQMVQNLRDRGHAVKTACFGVRTVQRIIASAVKRDMYFARNIEDAKDWLTK